MPIDRLKGKWKPDIDIVKATIDFLIKQEE